LKKYYLLFGLIFFLYCEDIGKGYDWGRDHPAGFSRTFGTLGYDYGWNAAYSPFDGGTIVVGRQSPQINGQTDMWAIKTDERGLLEWSHNFGGGQNEDGYDVIATSDGGFNGPHISLTINLWRLTANHNCTAIKRRISSIPAIIIS
jgi:hypothetical protein